MYILVSVSLTIVFPFTLTSRAQAERRPRTVLKAQCSRGRIRSSEKVLIEHKEHIISQVSATEDTALHRDTHHSL